ncbi:hypothetical protein ciss_01200 [Carboxydothermus islandicus]|uniref:ATP synthase subunit I n=1 Tax=Carboxydothermus islandicus TaxID=661089 RepID=A0A1L8CZ69_9THEO|nr:ATP synthase subunit I [Carboxydothermus islandicus]GAV24187.1 hypothetical protein ciss_01200 [Carboxydothermus islandicus]
MKKKIVIVLSGILFIAIMSFLYRINQPSLALGFALGGLVGFINLLAISLTVWLGGKIGRGKGLVLISYYIRLILLAILILFIVRKGVEEIIGFLLGFSFIKLSLLGLGLPGGGGE